MLMLKIAHVYTLSKVAVYTLLMVLPYYIQYT